MDLSPFSLLWMESSPPREQSQFTVTALWDFACVYIPILPLLHQGICLFNWWSLPSLKVTLVFSRVSRELELWQIIPVFTRSELPPSHRYKHWQSRLHPFSGCLNYSLPWKFTSELIIDRFNDLILVLLWLELVKTFLWGAPEGTRVMLHGGEDTQGKWIFLTGPTV